MAKWVLDVTEEDIDAALEDARNHPPEPNAVSATYDSAFDLIVLGLDTGRRLAIPREELQGLENATSAQLADIQIFGGNDIAWPQLDVDHYLPHLIEGKYASECWKQARKQQVAA